MISEQEETNRQVVSSVKFSEYSEEVMEKTMSDSEIGRMTIPVRVKHVDMKKCSLNRRLAVNE